LGERCLALRAHHIADKVLGKWSGATAFRPDEQERARKTIGAGQDMFDRWLDIIEIAASMPAVEPSD
jgi:hypothetical protein